ncbi:unnamed protein product (mitochondrion) [Plasmodiophora brassicae]|uniref:Vacuolar fusion protein MON1 homolog n=1 Tax=Plasmodiophora brassicae TaxID=37360 RepID=A0A0G4ITW5_PLABS|nr:hypothetical protein PBRA_006887 [Plasmodiophora brassicae]SPR00599.1 unnamed protein product [Plasmodiophora brassicae]
MGDDDDAAAAAAPAPTPGDRHPPVGRSAFFQQDPHAFLLSWAARPIFALHELDAGHESFVALLSALISNAHALGDRLRCVRAGATSICFGEFGPIYIVVASARADQAILLPMLDALYGQFLLLLSESAPSMLEKHPGYDLRHLMGGVDSLLRAQSQLSLNEFSFVADVVQAMPLAPSSRSAISSAVLRHRRPDSHVMSIVILRGHSLVQVAHRQGMPLALRDCMLLVTFANHLSVLSMSDVFTPVCLPAFNARAFAYAHLSTLADDVFLIQITADSNDLAALQGFKQDLQADLLLSGALDLIRQAPRRPPLEMLGVTDVNVRHCIAVSRACGQMVDSQVQAPLAETPADRELCLGMHRRALSMMGTVQPSARLVVEMRCSHTSLALRLAGDVDVFLIVSPLLSRSDAIQCGRRAGTAIQQRRKTLFAMTFASWS